MIKWIKSKKDIKEAERLMKTEKSRGFIVILDPSDMGKKRVADFLKIIASDQYNAIYFAGKLKDEISIELVSGEDNLTLKDGTILQNKARILNRTEPRNILNLHADRLQLEKLLKELRPRKVCLFHQNPQNLSSVRRWINEKYPFVNETYALYGTKKEIQIKH